MALTSWRSPVLDIRPRCPLLPQRGPLLFPQGTAVGGVDRTWNHIHPGDPRTHAPTDPDLISFGPSRQAIPF